MLKKILTVSFSIILISLFVFPIVGFATEISDPILALDSSLSNVDSTPEPGSDSVPNSDTGTSSELEDSIVDKWEPNVILQSITDPKNMLGSTKTLVNDAILKAQTEANEYVYFVIIPRFDGAINGEDWCNKSAEKSNLSLNAVIFAVAYETGEQTVYIPAGSPNLDIKKLKPISDVAQEFVTKGQWSSAAIAVAEAVIAQTTKATYSPIAMWVIIGLIIIFIIGLFVFKILIQSSSRHKKQSSFNPLDIEQSDKDDFHHDAEFDPTITSTSLVAIKIDEQSDTKAEAENTKRRRRRRAL
jgi:hypothetical protein